MRRSRTIDRLPLILGQLAIVALLFAFIVPALLSPAPAWPRFRDRMSGCDADSKTIRHRNGAALGAGLYRPCLFDTGLASGEPGLAISRDGSLLLSVTKDPTGIAVSSDHGVQWTRRALPKGAPDGIPDGYIDPVTDRYFYSGLGDTPVYSTDDKGATWHAGHFDSGDRYDWNKVFSGRPVTPRTAGYPTNIYYCNMTMPGGFFTGARCFKSVDGGLNFKTSGRDPYKSGDCKNLTQPRGSGTGRGIVDPADGAIYLPVHFCGAIELAVSRDEGATWERRTVLREKGSAARGILNALASPAWRHQLMNGRANVVPAEMAANQFSDALAIDKSGRLFLVWIDDAYLPVLAWSADKGRTWSAPERIGPPGLAQAVLPSLAIASDGRAGLSYYGTTDKARWTGYLAISDAPSAIAPVFDTAAITRPGAPLMPEPCCWASGPQEYTVARWVPDGTLWGAFVATAPKGDGHSVLGRLVRP